ncbi:MAG: maleylacetoacetate isomerase [Pseudomonadota bacterium]
MKLYSYWRSTTAYRVRIALALKGISFAYVPVDLLAGAQRSESFRRINPIMGLPALELPSGDILTQSMAIIEYLEASFPACPLLPADPMEAAEIRAAALLLATDIHPLVNLKACERLMAMGQTREDALDWTRHWMLEGLTAFQALVRPHTTYAFGAVPSLADICLVAQLYNGHRWGIDMAGLERLTAIEEACLNLPAFQAAHPDRQPDAH